MSRTVLGTRQRLRTPQGPASLSHLRRRRGSEDPEKIAPEEPGLGVRPAFPSSRPASDSRSAVSSCFSRTCAA